MEANKELLDEWELHLYDIMLCPAAAMNMCGTSEVPPQCSRCRHNSPHKYSPHCSVNCGIERGGRESCIVGEKRNGPGI
jgi:hypothetical protein